MVDRAPNIFNSISIETALVVFHVTLVTVDATQRTHKAVQRLQRLRWPNRADAPWRTMANNLTWPGFTESPPRY